MSPFQAFQNLPWWAKATFAFAALVLSVFVADVVSKKPEVLDALISQNSKKSDIQSVNITVVNRRDSQPVDNVEIQIIANGPPISKMTDRNGYFDVQIPSRKTAQIVLKKEGFRTAREIINLEADPDTTRIIYLDPTKVGK
jgi:hypothetical protein